MAADKTRKRLVAAARAILRNPRARTAFSLEAVATRARVTRLTVYNQFKNRRGLLEAVFDDVAQTGRLDRLAQVFTQRDPREALHSLVTIFCEFWGEHGGLLVNLSREMQRDSDLADGLAARNDRRRTALGTLLSRLPDRGPAVEELVSVLHAITSFEFYRQLRTPDRSPADVQRILHALVDSVLRTAWERGGH